jgi:hypothetical protein
MSRISQVALGDAWYSDDIREAVLAGTRRIRLPIKSIDFPSTHSMRQVSHGRAPASGYNGAVEMWLFGCQIIHRLGCGRHTHFWGERFPSPEEALHVFALMSDHHDELVGDQRGYALAFRGQQAIRVANLDGWAVVESLIHPLYRQHRCAEDRGMVLCRGLHDRDDIWLVQHREGVVAAYHNREIELSW